MALAKLRASQGDPQGFNKASIAKHTTQSSSPGSSKDFSAIYRGSIGAAMDASLQKYPLSPALKGDILRELWKESRPKPQLELDMCAYFEHYTTQCQRFSRDGGIHLCVKTHSELFEVTKMILSDMTRDHIRALLASQKLGDSVSKDETAIHTTMDLCASLLLMAEPMHKYGFSRSNPLPWANHQTLRQAASQHFLPQKELRPDNPRFGKLFTARNLGHIGGMRIRWTNNLVDHLRLNDDDQTVFIFHCVGFLKYHQRLVSFGDF